jgi:tryptophan synthase alpha chain
MTTRIQKRWSDLRADGRKALIPFVMAGDPDMKRSLEVVLAMADAGADIVELGVPFSEPVADGEVIQRAGGRALASGAYLPAILDLVKHIRQRSQVPLLIMSYLNPILRYGFQRFAADAVAAGADGALITDLSVEEAGPYIEEMRQRDFDTVFLASPTSTEERLRRVVEYSTGFVYAVSRTGITGTQASLSNTIVPLLEKLRKLTTTPIAAGFGISKPEHLAALAPHADGVIVGSALVRCLEEHMDDPAPHVAELIRHLRTGFPIHNGK